MEVGINSRLKRWLPAVLFLLLGVILSASLVPNELERMQWEIPGMPASYPVEQKCRPVFLSVMSFLPFIGAMAYAFMDTLARYVSRVFISTFLLCTAILTLIWLLADFTDNIERFRSHFDSPLADTLEFYGTQIPMVMNLILPYTLLMGALWTLSKLSGSSELTGMIQSGRSLLRLCLPVFFYASLVALVYGMCGFHWAPNASLYRQLMLKGSKNDTSNTLIYNNEIGKRIWRIARPPVLTRPGDPLGDVIVEQFSQENPGRVINRIEAERATWDKASASWIFHHAWLRNDETAKAHADTYSNEFRLSIEERPFQLITPLQSQRPDALGTTTILDHLHSRANNADARRQLRTEWHVRIAKVFSCLILVLIAIPSAVTFQRRSPMKGIGIAMLLAAFLLFLYEVCPSLGAAGVLPSWLSAWLPNFLYFGVFCYMFRTQLAHRSAMEWLADFREKHRSKSSLPA
ncbi:MAG: LptF/LptG family permease [Akkermansia sp.]|nr:LptF/LptG family permease [Akkermansia sp.]